jgi:ATP-dependent exoDNAse (exonuclease V) alpha subunit
MTSTNFETLDFNPSFKRALDLLEQSQKHVFIMGKAGTGKSTLLNYFKETTPKKIAVLAPTGVAAVNIQGQTIHSFFKFKPNITLTSVKRLRTPGGEKQNIYQKLDTIIIDEISMVRADLMDCVDRFLRLNGKNPLLPFGGIQMVFIGDLYQLPPVVSGHEKDIFKSYYQSPYFFSAHFFKDFEMELVELDHVYRQKDQGFIQILNAIRNNTVTDDDLKILNQQVDDQFSPPLEDFYIHLVPTNAYAETINEERLGQLEGKAHRFKGYTTGEFENSHLPTLMDLQMKVGAQIMMVNNDAKGRWINGTIGKIVGFQKEKSRFPVVVVELETGFEVEVTAHTWELYRFSLEPGATEKITSEVIGTFSQYPMKLAWAITIHKSQGKTFNKAIIDLGKSVFTSGQTYVALSRCTSLEGMVLKQPIKKTHVWTDYNIVKFITQYQYDKSEKACSLSDKITILKDAARNQTSLQIVYLKAKDVKSKRDIIPIKVETMLYMGKSFEGVLAHCLERQEERVFRVDRILEIQE